MTQQQEQQPTFKTTCETCPATVTVPDRGLLATGASIRALGWVAAGGFMRFRCGECEELSDGVG